MGGGSLPFQVPWNILIPRHLRVWHVGGCHFCSMYICRQHAVTRVGAWHSEVIDISAHPHMFCPRFYEATLIPSEGSQLLASFEVRYDRLLDLPTGMWTESLPWKVDHSHLQDLRNKIAQRLCIFEASCPHTVSATTSSVNFSQVLQCPFAHTWIFFIGSELIKWGSSIIFIGLRSGMPPNSLASSLLLSPNLGICILIFLKSVTDVALGLPVSI